MRAIVIVLAVPVPLFVFRAEVVLFVVHNGIAATRDVGPIVPSMRTRLFAD